MSFRHALLLVLSLSSNVVHEAIADPCHTNYGGCDKKHGMCWGTGSRTHYCACKAGFEQDRTTTKHVCKDVDECKENPCGEHSACTNTIGGYHCTCLCGYVMDYTGERCLNAFEISDICKLPKYCSKKSWAWAGKVPFDPIFAEYGFLPDYTEGYKVMSPSKNEQCSCGDGFVKNECGYCLDIDECSKGTDKCNRDNGTCTNTEGSYFCGCKEGFVLGPCRKECYKVGVKIPVICEKPDLSSLNSTGNVSFSKHSFLLPITLQNFRFCSNSSKVGTTTVEKYDVDQDGIIDVNLTWTCVRKERINNEEISDSRLKLFTEEETKWDKWTCWSVCKATCWGGLQTRTRKCLHGLPGSTGCPGEGSQKRSCYSGEKCPYRIRKDVTTLTHAEKEDLIQAMVKYKNDMSMKGFHNAASAHGWPFQCDRRSCCPHGAKLKFLTWHRSIILNFEEGLARYLKHKTLGIPYWNWLADMQAPPDFVWKRTVGRRLNPFANMTVLIDRKGPMRTIQRDANVDMQSLQFSKRTWREVAKKLIKPHLMHEFSESLESAHGGPHVSVCNSLANTNKCALSFVQLAFAGFDPLFMLHHSMVDRMWAMAQKEIADAGNTTWSAQTALEALEDRADFGRKFMPFSNKSLNSFPKVSATGSMHDAHFYTELTGVKYDNLQERLNVQGRTKLLTAQKRQRRKGGIDTLFIAQYFQSVESNVYINYYVERTGLSCSNYTEASRIGNTILLGTDQLYRNSIPNLVATEKVRSWFNNLDVDIPVKACYTAVRDCRSTCPELSLLRLRTMPNPNLVYYLPNQPVDVYKFNWSPGKKLPSWNINVEGSSQWIYFYGTGSGNITQVPTAMDWRNCAGKRGRRFHCSVRACILPVGIYYLIDQNRTNCEAGLKMIIASRK